MIPGVEQRLYKMSLEPLSVQNLRKCLRQKPTMKVLPEAKAGTIGATK